MTKPYLRIFHRGRGPFFTFSSKTDKKLALNVAY